MLGVSITPPVPLILPPVRYDINPQLIPKTSLKSSILCHFIISETLVTISIKHQITQNLISRYPYTKTENKLLYDDQIRVAPIKIHDRFINIPRIQNRNVCENSEVKQKFITMILFIHFIRDEDINKKKSNLQFRARPNLILCYNWVVKNILSSQGLFALYMHAVVLEKVKKQREVSGVGRSLEGTDMWNVKCATSVS